jgi:hypothetical protein
MRFYALAAMLVLVAGVSACSKSGSDQSSSTATTAPDAAATAAADTGGAAATAEPKADGSAAGADVYPSATLKAGGTSSNGMMGGTAAGKVYVTDDSYDKVTAWYKDHMPADAHETHVSAAGSNSTVYVTGLGTSHQETLSISSSPATQGKTWISVADIKK